MHFKIQARNVGLTKMVQDISFLYIVSQSIELHLETSPLIPLLVKGEGKEANCTSVAVETL